MNIESSFFFTIHSSLKKKCLRYKYQRYLSFNYNNKMFTKKEKKNMINSMIEGIESFNEQERIYRKVWKGVFSKAIDNAPEWTKDVWFDYNWEEEITEIIFSDWKREEPSSNKIAHQLLFNVEYTYNPEFDCRINNQKN